MILEAFILGTSGSIPLPHRYLTSVLLRRDGEIFLFDCGEATQMALRQINLKWKRISVIFISHMHADHVTGLPGILMLSSQVERSDPITIIGPAKLKQYIQNVIKDLDIYINYPIHIREIDNPDEPQVVYAKEDFKVTSFPLKHSKPCVGYSFEEYPRAGIFNPKICLDLNIPKGPLWGNLQKGESITLENGIKIDSSQVMSSPRLGRKFCFVTDTLYSSNIINEVKEANLLIMEAMFLEKHYEQSVQKKHMTASSTASIAKKANVDALGIIHFSPRYNKPELRELGKEAKKIFNKSFLTYDGQRIEIPYPEKGKVDVTSSSKCQ